MENPARELASLLATWHVPGRKSPLGHRRQVARANGTTFASQHTRAMALIGDIARSIDTLEHMGQPVEHFRASMPHWQDAVLSVSLPWNSQVSQDTRCISEAHLHLLEALAGHLDLWGASIAPARERIEAALDRVTSAEEFVRHAEGISEATRLYMLALLADIRHALETGNTAAAASRVAEFIGAATLVAENSPEGSKQRTAFRALSRSFVTGFAGGFAGEGASRLIDAVTQLLT